MHSILAPSADRNSSEPPLICPYRPCSKVERRSLGRQWKSCRCELASSIAWLCSLRSGAQIIAVITQFVCLIATPMLFESSAGAQTALRPQSIDRFADFVAEASARFAVPVRWIRAVIQIESAGDEHAVSSRGAMGLMQLMPGTWLELSVRYGLGLDPFDPRGNILAGTAYLKELYDRFGSAGFLAAYHAGPTRYEQHLATGQPLPAETVSYVAAVTPLLGNEQGEHAAFHIRRAVPWREAPLFVERGEAR
ncbi:lytic transglycosylase domain-containing protein [Bradyrhizobium sp. STM 3557]|uniref:lytic transglycosylase domain-containing protein n=1 Tax=Bradyrhizobium sp. STM 3557 TaxID=578920 RepID=UPI00388E88B7